MELHLSLTERRGLAAQIYAQLRAAVLEGRLRKGERLPATRQLAERLGVSRNTVSDAYDRLLAEGFLRGRIGDGTYVSSDVPTSHSLAATVAKPASAAARADTSGPPARRNSALPFDFQPGVPDAARFPFDAWRRASNRALRGLAREMVYYGEPEGLPELREAIAAYVGFSRGVKCCADDVIVTSGAQQALDLLGRALIKPGTQVAVEEPGYPPARAIFASHGARVAAVPVDSEGLIVERLPRRAKLVYTTPSHQFPLGTSMSLRRRAALIDWASTRDAVIVEDDYDCEYRFDGRSLEALQSLDTAGRVVYVGTFSKVLLPALRLGFLVAPPAQRERIVAFKRLADWQSHVPGQAALAIFMQDGHLAKHIRRMRRVYEARRKLLLDRLSGEFAGWLDPVPGAAGLHMAAVFKQPVNTQALIDAARMQGVGVYDLVRFYAGPKPQPGLMFGYGDIEETAIAQGLDRLREIMRRTLSGRRGM